MPTNIKMGCLIRKILIFVLILAGNNGFADVVAVPEKPPCQSNDDACWKQQYKEVCGYDPIFCKRLVDSGGSWRQPKWEVKQNLQNLAPEIYKTGKAFGVDPRAIAAAVFTENSINVNLVDSFEDFAVKFKIAKAGKIPIINKSFSFGWGQLYIEAARSAEPLVAKIEGRTQLRTDQEIQEQLEIPSEAMKYIAGVMKHIQDVYSQNGYDISKNPAVVATLYNIGNPETHARETKSSGHLPRVNFFGFFTEHYMGVLQDTLKTGAAAQAAEDAIAAKPAQQVAALTVAKKDLVTKVGVIQMLPLFRDPPKCGNDASSKAAEYQKIASFQDATRIGAIAAKSSYDVIAPGFGCRLSGDPEAWSLIRGSDGSVGWVKDDVLKKASTKLVLQKPDCSTSSEQGNQCMASVKSVTGEKFSEKDSSGDLIIGLATKKKDGKANWKMPVGYDGMACDNGGAVSSGMGGGFAGAASSANNYGKYSNLNTISNGNIKSTLNLTTAPALTPEEVKTIQKRYDDFKNRIKTTLGLADYDLMSPKDPYENILVQMSYAIDNFKQCLPQASNASPKACIGDKDILKSLETAKITANPGYLEWKAIRDSTSFIYMVGVPIAVNPSPSPSTSQSIAASIQARKDELNKIFKPCLDIPKSLQQGSDYISTIETGINSLTQQSMAYFNNQNGGIDGNLKSAASACQLVLDVRSGAFDKNKDCAQCAAQMGYTYFNGANVDMNTLKPMLGKDDDQDAFLNDTLPATVPSYYFPSPNSNSAMNGMNGMGGQQYDYCGGYDPMATADQIKKILSNPCVKAVYVPDPWLEKKFLNVPGKVIWRPFLTDDRYAVELTNSSCMISEKDTAKAGRAK
jgi:hypothetical protein